MRIVSRGMATIIAALSVAGSASAAPVETVLYTFAGGSDGVPFAGLIADKLGALYGTTVSGGIGNNGTVFELTPPPTGQTAWKETVLYRFCSLSNCSDGAQPRGGLITDKQGALYGTTSLGGGRGCAPLVGCGTVFKLTPPPKGQTAWKETVLYSFAGGSDGATPFAGLVADEQQWALYGTTVSGGVGNNGTVFELAPPAKGQTAWKEAVVYRFCSLSNCSDGAVPYAGLIANKHGALHGTTAGGGSSGGFGTVFKLTPPAKGRTAWTEAVLYSFAGGSDGNGPAAGLLADQGALYGTTEGGGGVGNNGTVFKLTPPAKGETAWKETVRGNRVYQFKVAIQNGQKMVHKGGTHG